MKKNQQNIKSRKFKRNDSNSKERQRNADEIEMAAESEDGGSKSA